MKKGNNIKKPFYKRTWFIVIVALFIIGTIGNIIDPSNNSQNSPGVHVRLFDFDIKNNSTKKKPAVKKETASSKQVVVSNKKKSSDSKNAVHDKVQNQNQLKRFARSFGNKDVESLQKYSSSVYPSTEINVGMEYAYKSPAGTLYRIDNSTTNITKVYSDKNGKLGNLLYTGRTILQKQGTKIIYMN